MIHRQKNRNKKVEKAWELRESYCCYGYPKDHFSSHPSNVIDSGPAQRVM
jgi:hypothetical protein